MESHRWIYDTFEKDVAPLKGPAFLTEDAAETLAKLRENPDATAGLKGVIRGTWSQERNTRAVRELAIEMKSKLDAAIDAPGPQ